MWTKAELIQLILNREADAPASKPEPEPGPPRETYLEWLRRRALEDEAAGRAITMNTLRRSVPKPRPPRKPRGG